MKEIPGLHEANDVARKALAQDEGFEGHDSSWSEARDRLTDYVDRLREGRVPWADDPKDIAGYLGLADSLLSLGLRKVSADATALILGKLALSEPLAYSDPEPWNRLGTLLARHGNFGDAKACLMGALLRADLAKSQDHPSILANLSALSLQLGDLTTAGTWADRAAYLLRHDWEVDLEARLTLDLVRLDLARAHGDEQALRIAAESLAESGSRYARQEDADPSLALATLVALAAARHEANPGGPELAELALLNVSAQVTLGLDHRETITAQAALAAAEFEAAGGWAGLPGATNSRTLAAVEIFEDATSRAARTSSALGQDHPRTRTLRTALAAMKAAITPSPELPPLVNRIYTPDDSDARNKAKRKALAREQHVIRLTAHGGASYLLEENYLFYDQVIDALNRRVRLDIVITNPWNSLASHLPRDESADPANHSNIDQRLENSTYYQETFRPVTESYQSLKRRYPGLIELRLVRTDIPASMLITSDTIFVESYITSNPEARTGKGMDFQEAEFGRDSRYYTTTLKEFENQWGLSSTWEDFQENQESHKDTLRSEMEAHEDVHLRKNVISGEVPRP
jgi:hypothetical protein